ncbi:hypothetical protein ILYODFUR_022295 [Ilyodon furcidens]|uniref:Uncharacterized protein n=1 Tax=Ilyodon furcidens TaxID=33524 RepID=A0ABV0UAE4_9TELE
MVLQTMGLSSKTASEATVHPSQEMALYIMQTVLIPHGFKKFKTGCYDSGPSACSALMQSTHRLHFAAALERNQPHATHLWMCSYIQPSERQTVPDFRKHFASSYPAFLPA